MTLRPTPNVHLGAVPGWLIATSVYLLAVFHRSTLGVAGLQAEQRFGISPAQLGVFVMLQLAVYTAMQIPTGVLVDRYGPRRLLVAAAATMGVAQLIFAVAPSYPTALLARAMLGCGDALTFVSVVRFASVNFVARRFPLVLAATATLGFAGNVVATLPLTAALHAFGWTPTFALVGALSVLSGAVVWCLLPAGPQFARSSRDVRQLVYSVRRVGGRVSDAWQTPGTRLGFWVHFSAMAATTTFVVLWGQPYLISQGFSAEAASSVLLANVLLSAVCSPLVGHLVGRHPRIRVPMAVCCVAGTLLGWTLVLLVFPGTVPGPVIAPFVIICAIGGPVSSVGFALARDYNDPTIVGTATGVVNGGGWSATMVATLLVGIILNAVGNTGPGAFRVAFVTLVAIETVGLIQVLRWWRRARARNLSRQAAGERVPVPVVAGRFDRQFARSGLSLADAP